LCCPQLALHSFPTRRSSDLRLPRRTESAPAVQSRFTMTDPGRVGIRVSNRVAAHGGAPPVPAFVTVATCLARQRSPTRTPSSPRSEEHTSELQSRENLVCRL